MALIIGDPVILMTQHKMAPCTFHKTPQKLSKSDILSVKICNRAVILSSHVKPEDSNVGLLNLTIFCPYKVSGSKK